jgi:hypothetical protein
MKEKIMAKRTNIETSAMGVAQAATQAMLGDIVRGLIELITNADDAYQSSDGDIIVEVTAGAGEGELAYTVRDAAIGLTGQGLHDAFTEIGGKKSNLANGGMSRGLLGRGAKDCAIFGSITFETIRDGKFSALVIDRQGSITYPAEDLPATNDHYEALCISDGKSGLSARINARAAVDQPKPSKLREKLATDAQLRDLVKKRKVILKDYRDPALDGELKSPLPVGDEVLNEKFVLEGFAGECQVIVRRLAEPQPNEPDVNTANGLLIKAGTTVFQNTWFALKSKPASRLLAGEVLVPPIIDVLLEELRSEEFPDNPLVTPTRDGLSLRHPLYKAIASSVSSICLPLFDSIAKESEGQRTEGKKLAEDFRVAANAMKGELANLLREIDDEEDSADPMPLVSDLEAIPHQIQVQPDEKFSITLRASDELKAGGVLIEAAQSSSFAPVGFKFGTAFETSWQPHARLSGKKSTTISMHAPEPLGVYDIRFTYSGKSCQVRVVVVEPSIVTPILPTQLQFSPNSASVSPGRGKNLEIQAPLDYVGQVLQISHSGTPIAKCSAEVTMRADATGKFAQAKVHVKSGANRGLVEIEAKTSSGESAKAKLNIVEAQPAGLGGLEIKFELDGDKNAVSRYDVELREGKFVCKIYPYFKAYAGVFGAHNEVEGKFEHEDSIAGRTVLVHSAAQAFAEHLTEREFVKKPEGRWDAANTNTRVRKYAERFMPLLHRSLLVSTDSE